jgi:hypothetical protein|uniref:Uncharacterized protein n=1 Tax=viral metagenome TaxID=1070528 RepID=A0A6C0K4P5_9ZZZZ
MSYDTSTENSSVYADMNNYSLVNSTPSYHTLGNYYTNINCPYQNTPGQCLVRPIVISPAFGGVAYNIPGFNVNSAAPNTPLSDSNYFNISNAYPQFCKTNLVNSTYS